ncbi:helix-turn-helix transcriptional regulator [uncultured Megasphaera sp.]|uniref:helix-turn-helix transcriptional regulator n=2 Tax=Megasphaera TaxID=906 RepID=UPI002598BC9C|nr:helix-turn-helix transcriptional regulator [uncultured Megasphaera sp.]
MYEFTDLFDRRIVVGAKLERILDDRKCTKAELCRGAHVSRPTIDKLLAGTLTSKTNYEKHIEKILTYLKITPDMILGNIIYSRSRARKIRNLMNVTSEELSHATGIPIERLKQIEAGEKGTLAEMRDIAMYFSTSVNVLCGENFFEPQIGILGDLLDYSEEKELGGFWGHIGILPRNSNVYKWYPITNITRQLIYRMMEKERIIVPCMDNKVLLLYMPNIKEIILLDEACDDPHDMNWDPNVTIRNVPLAIYEALDDYIYLDDNDSRKDKISDKLKQCLDDFIKANGWDEEDIFSEIYKTTIYYADNKIRSMQLDFERSDSIISEIQAIYEFEDDTFSENVIAFVDFEAMETILNLKNVSMIEFPFITLENALKSICDEI